MLKHELFIERLEASRAPYSKSHARRLKRKEKEELTAGGLGSLKAALPSIAPTTTRTRPATTITGDRSAGELDAAATTTVTAAAIDASVKPTIDINKLKSKQQQPIADQLDVPPSLPTTRPGQIGEGHGAPLVKSQRRRALKAERFRQPLIRSNPEFAANPFETIRTHARNTLVPHRPTN
ncbi:hypothetical protein BGY98DRAFT_24925 [Russula aff. rugulosa BPL654]|nr:hypothetical protein BGY98DRAFT_24925 [Russula aff. rugulosa BPL654]